MMLISIHSDFIRYKSLAHDQIHASYWTIWLMNINEFLKLCYVRIREWSRVLYGKSVNSTKTGTIPP